MSVSQVPKPPPRGADLPCDDGEPMETWRHRRQASVLLDSLNEAWRDRHDYFAAANMFLYFSETQSRKNDFRGPDAPWLRLIDDTGRVLPEPAERAEAEVARLREELARRS